MLLVLVPSVEAFGVALAVAGAAIGVGMTAAYTSGGALLPPDAHATGFGLMMTASLIGLAASPIVAGFISGPELRVVFEADIVLLVVLAGVVWTWMASGLSRRPAASGTLLPDGSSGFVFVAAAGLPGQRARGSVSLRLSGRGPLTVAFTGGLQRRRIGVSTAGVRPHASPPLPLSQK